MLLNNQQSLLNFSKGLGKFSQTRPPQYLTQSQRDTYTFPPEQLETSGAGPSRPPRTREASQAWSNREITKSRPPSGFDTPQPSDQTRKDRINALIDALIDTTGNRSKTMPVLHKDIFNEFSNRINKNPLSKTELKYASNIVYGLNIEDKTKNLIISALSNTYSGRQES